MSHRRFERWMLFFLWADPVFSAQVLVMEPQERLTGVVSSQELNRIQVVGDRIASVFGSQGSFSVEPEEVNGQVFLKVPPQGLSRLDLSVVTESGLTQDLLLTIQPGSGQTLLLKPGKRRSQTEGEAREILPEVALIKAMATSAREGYGRQKVSQPLARWHDVAVSCVEIWRGEGLEGRVYHVRNLSSALQTFHEKHFWFSPDTVAVALERFRLESGRTLRVFVVLKRSSHD